MTDASANAAELLAEMAWVRTLARALVRNASDGDDLAQDVASEWLRGGPGWARGDGLRGWLAARLRQRAVDHARRDQARQRRELATAAGAPAAAGAPVDEMLARLERQRRVADAVRDLAEPFRTAVLLRYLDELSIADVAVRTGVTEVAVRKRLQRGLAMLRERLDGAFGAPAVVWASWLSAPTAAATTAAATSSTLATISGVSLMMGKLTAVSVVLVAALVVWWAPWRVDDPLRAEVGGHGVVVPAADRGELPIAAERIAAPTANARDGAPAATDAAAVPGDAETGFAIGGRVFVDDQPGLPTGIAIVAHGAPAAASIAFAAGGWSLRTADAGPWTLWVTSPATVPAQIPLPTLPLAAGSTFDLHLSSGRTLDLTFVDAAGAPLAGMPFVCCLSIELSRSAGRVISNGAEQELRADDAGRALVRGVPEQGHAFVTVDTTKRRRLMKIGGTRGLENTTTGAPIWELALVPSLPQRIEARIVAERPIGEAFAPGRVPAWANAPGREVAVVVYEETIFGDRRRDLFYVAVDAQGAFELRATAPSRHRIWLEQGDGTLLSDQLTVAFDHPGAHPEIVFAPRQVREVMLHVINVPARGQLEVRVVGEGEKTTVACRGGVLDVPVHLVGEQPVRVALAASGEPTKNTWQVSLPTEAWANGVVTVDLAGSWRRLELADDVVGAAFAGGQEVQVALLPCRDGEPSTGEAVTAIVGGGLPGMAVHVPFGRHVFACVLADGRRLWGVVETGVADGERLVLRPRTQNVPAEALRPGVRLDEIDGCSLRRLPAALRTIAVGEGDETVALPIDGVWSRSEAPR